MLKNLAKQTEQSRTLGPGIVETTPKPRKKLSFKEPEIFNYLKLRKPKTTPAASVRSPASVGFTFDENLSEEENEELESQAMRVVRTVGQAFEVCHKLSLNNATEDRVEKDREENRDRDRDRDVYEDQDVNEQPSPSSVHKDISLLGDAEDSEQTSVPCLLRSHEIPATTGSPASPIRRSPSGTVTSDSGGLLVGGELTGLKHEIQLLRERLEQQSQQTRAAVAHARFLQDQIAAETAARVEAQARTHQLLVQNKELLEHIGALVGHLREQERISGGHVNSSTSATMQQTVPDLSNLGQRTGGQSSAWELDRPSSPYCSYPPESLYPGNLHSSIGLQGNGSSTDQLQFQTQLLERLLQNASPYQSQRSPYATPSPYAITPSLLLPPNGRQSNSAQLSPSSMSLRVSQPNSFSSSPVMTHKLDYGFNLDSAEPPSSLIKPLPCSIERNVARSTSVEINGKQNQHEELPPILLDPPPQGKRFDGMAKQSPAANQNSSQKNFATILRTPGPPPSRTTSARLPSRTDLMCEVQRTAWARHTTK